MVTHRPIVNMPAGLQFTDPESPWKTDEFAGTMNITKEMRRWSQLSGAILNTWHIEKWDVYVDIPFIHINKMKMRFYSGLYQLKCYAYIRRCVLCKSVACGERWHIWQIRVRKHMKYQKLWLKTCFKCSKAFIVSRILALHRIFLERLLQTSNLRQHAHEASKKDRDQSSTELRWQNRLFLPFPNGLQDRASRDFKTIFDVFKSTRSIRWDPLENGRNNRLRQLVLQLAPISPTCLLF